MIDKILNFIIKLRKKHWTIRAGLALITGGITILISTCTPSIQEEVLMFCMSVVVDTFETISYQSPSFIGSVIVGTILIILGIGLCIIGTKITNKVIKRKLGIFKIDGYKEIDLAKHLDELGYQEYEYQIYEPKIIDVMVGGVNKTKISMIDRFIKTEVDKIIHNKDIDRIAYTGTAPIPITFLIGKHFEKQDIDDYIEYHKNKNKYYKLNSSASYPEIIFNPDGITPQKDIKEIVIALNFTTRINDEDMKGFNCDKLKITVQNPKDNTITSKEQLMDYKEKIFDYLESFIKDYPKLEKIHLLCACQSCLPFELGKSIDNRRFCKIFAYQYNYQSEFKYTWSILINGREDDEIFIEPQF